MDVGSCSLCQNGRASARNGPRAMVAPAIAVRSIAEADAGSVARRTRREPERVALGKDTVPLFSNYETYWQCATWEGRETGR